jgi:5'-3' exonuclease
LRVHLVDGTYELFRSYYGAPKQLGPDGKEIGATLGIMRSFLGLIQNEGATHVAVAYDHVIESFRNELYGGYKTGAGIEPELWNQFQLAEDATRALGMVVWSMIEFEADDALASGAVRYAQDPEVEQVLICSPDKDLTQCVRDNKVVCVDRRRKKTIGVAGVIEKFGVPPESIPDYLALVGDTSDGYPGIPRWGEKSSAAVLSVYKHLEAIPDDDAKWTVKVRGSAELAANLRAMRPEAALFKQLATLRYDVPLTENTQDLQWRGADKAMLTGMLDRLGDRSFIERIPAWR